MQSRMDGVREALALSGKDAGLADSLARIDAVVQNWRRQVHKRELGHRATRALGLDLDLAQIDVLFAIEPTMVFDSADADEIMVSSVAERLHIDPSRASRLVSDMVTAGYVRRAVSQRDARRTILELTPAGEAVVEAVLGYKWLLLGEFFSGWSKADLQTFVPLMERYSRWFADTEQTEQKFASEIAELARGMDAAKAAQDSGRKSG